MNENINKNFQLNDTNKTYTIRFVKKDSTLVIKQTSIKQNHALKQTLLLLRQVIVTELIFLKNFK